MTAKDHRIDFRANAHEKDLLARAADLLGLNLSSFLRSAALKAAKNIISEKETFVLSKKDSEKFLTALENPPLPSKRLERAASRYAKRVAPTAE